MMEKKLEKVKSNLVKQYSELERVTESQMNSKLHNIDWAKELEKLKKSLRLNLILQGVFYVLLMVMAAAYMAKVIPAESVLIVCCMMIIFITRLNTLHSRITSKLRLLGLLFVVYS